MSNSKAELGDRLKYYEIKSEDENVYAAFFGKVIGVSKNPNNPGLLYHVSADNGSFHKIDSSRIYEVIRNNEVIYRR